MPSHKTLLRATAPTWLQRAVTVASSVLEAPGAVPTRSLRHRVFAASSGLGKLQNYVSSSRRNDVGHLRLIKLATNPAPNPLSIFTTVTFDAHELSIPSSAATPPKEAP